MKCPPGADASSPSCASAEKLPDAVKFIREQLDEGRQAYIVYPLVEESERLEAKAATAEFAKWRELLAPMQCEPAPRARAAGGKGRHDGSDSAAARRRRSSPPR